MKCIPKHHISVDLVTIIWLHTYFITVVLHCPLFNLIRVHFLLYIYLIYSARASRQINHILRKSSNKREPIWQTRTYHCKKLTNLFKHGGLSQTNAKSYRAVLTILCGIVSSSRKKRDHQVGKNHVSSCRIKIRLLHSSFSS